LQILYAWEMAGGGRSLEEFAEATFARRHVSPRYLEYVRFLVEGLDRRLPEVDAMIREHLSNWRLERLTAIDRGILRIGTAELLTAEDVPDRVAIHEAIRLAEKYGTEDSPRFVNGVLDAVARGRPVEN
jgi:N utilization substance protein B